MSKISLLILIFSFNSFANLSEGIQLIANGDKENGVKVLEQSFDQSSFEKQARMALILSRVKDIKMENSPIYYAKYALKFLKNNLSNEEKALLNIELADYHLGIGSLVVSEKYYKQALSFDSKKAIDEYINYRLAWVYYNNEEFSRTKKHLLKVLKTTKLEMRNDALYLLGKTSVETSTNIIQFLGQEILNDEFFLKGAVDSKEYISKKEIKGQYSNFFYSVHGKVENACAILDLNKLNLPTDLEISSDKVTSYLKSCLVNDPKRSQNVQALIVKNNWRQKYSDIYALSHLMNGNKEESCKLYKEKFKTDNSAYKGMIVSCQLKDLDLEKVVKLETSCKEDIYLDKVENETLEKILKYREIGNQSLVFQLLKQNIDNDYYHKLLEKLDECSKKREIFAARALKINEDLSQISYSKIFNPKCDNNDQNMLITTYLKSTQSTNDLEQNTVECINKNLSGKSKQIILSQVDFNNVKERKCLFDFDCDVQRYSNYVTKNKAMTHKVKLRSLKTYHWRLNQLLKVKSQIQKRVSSSNIESLYSKISVVKRLFKKPAFYNESLLAKASNDYNSTIDQFVSKIIRLEDLAPEQKNILVKALASEKVVL